MTCPTCHAPDLPAGTATCPHCHASLAAGTAPATHIAVNLKAGSVTGGKVAGVSFEKPVGSVTIINKAGDGMPEVLEDLTQDHIKLERWEPETVIVPGGEFTMGSAPGEGVPDYETPAHAVSLPVYRIGKYSVTNLQYAAFIKDKRGQAVPRGWFNRAPPLDRPDLLVHPVTNVSWEDAMAYCDWLSGQTGRRYTLPSEAEWEKAARGTDGRRYPWGDAWADGRCNVGGAGTTPVTAFPNGASTYGCLDLLGNVQEWTRTLWGNRLQPPDFGYPYDPDDGREVMGPADLPAQARLVHRGGSYQSPPGEVRCSLRSQSDPDSRIPWGGFRVMMPIVGAT